MVGCWTAQRVSDYNNLSKDSIHTYTKRWIEDVPDPINQKTAQKNHPENEKTAQKKIGKTAQNIIDILALTGIPATNRRVVDKIVDKYSYFD